MKYILLIFSVCFLQTLLYAQLKVQYSIDQDMAYRITISNVSGEKVECYTFDPYLITNKKEEVKDNYLRIKSTVELKYFERHSSHRLSLSPGESKSFSGNLRSFAQHWDWHDDNVKYVIFEYHIPFRLLSTGKENIFHQIDTLKLKTIKPEFTRVPASWEIISSISEQKLCSDIANKSFFPVRMLLTTPPEIFRSTAFIYTFDGTQWKSVATEGLYQEEGRIHTITLQPQETLHFESNIKGDASELTGVAFVGYRFYYFIPSTYTFRREWKEVSLILGSLKDNNGNITENVYSHFDKAPSFPGGIKSLTAFIRKHTANFPKGIKCKIKFIVEKDGHITYPYIMYYWFIKDFDYEKEIVPIIHQMPKWTPAYINGKPVRAFVDIEIPFQQTVADNL